MAAHIFPLVALFLGLYFGSKAQQSEVIYKFQETFDSYTTTANNLIHTIDELILNKTSSISNFLSEIDYTSLLRQAKSLNNHCPYIQDTLNDLRSSLKIEFTKLETPLLNRKLSIKERLASISSSLIIYMKLVENKLYACKTQNINCNDTTNNWLKEKINSLLCREINDCKKHTISKRSICDENEYQCGMDSECIPAFYVCDETPHCNNGADEYPLCKKHCFGGFHCRNLRCIDKGKICDGKDDCGDESDEEYCPEKEVYSAANCSVQTGNYLCENKNCVHLAELCDGRNDCGDNSDESGQCGLMEGCSSGCAIVGGICFSSPKGNLCLNRCPQGMSEKKGQCVPGLESPVSSLAELLEEVPKMLERYSGSIYYLKKRFITKMHQALEVCQPSIDIESISSLMLNNSLNANK